MITFSEIKSKMEILKLPAEAIELMSSAQSSMGSFTLDYLDRVVDELNADEITLLAEIIQFFPMWHRELEAGSSPRLKKALASVLQQTDQYVLDLLSCFVVDIHSNKALNAKIPATVNKDLFLYQFNQIEDLPFSEMSLALAINAVDLAKTMDLSSELKRYCYYKDLTIENKEIDIFRTVLENNEQHVTESNIKLVGAQVPGTVKNFIQDYHQTFVNLAAGNSSYGVANYVTTSSNLKVLNEMESLVLRRILETYSFLLYARYSEEEIKDYDEDRDEMIYNLSFAIMDAPIPNRNPVQALPSNTSDQFRSPQPLPQQQYVDELSHPVQPKPATPQPVPKSQPPKPTPQSAQQPGVKMPHFAPDPKGISQRPSEITNPARVRELINHHPDTKPQPQLQRGIVHDATNIKIDEESNRIEQERQQKMDSIARKLEELRQRNKNQ